MNQRLSTSAIWIAAAVVAVGAGTMAVVAAAADSGDRLTQDEIADRLDRARGSTSPPDTETPGDTSPPAEGTASKTLSSTGGVIQATCEGTAVFLDSWSPESGYRVDEVGRGPAEEAFVFLESDSADDVTIFVHCENGTPVANPIVEEDDHGGDDDDDDDNSGPGSG